MLHTLFGNTLHQMVVHACSIAQESREQWCVISSYGLYVKNKRQWLQEKVANHSLFFIFDCRATDSIL